MNEITPSSQAQVGDIVAVHPLGDDALLLLAWSEEELPSEGLAAFRDRKTEKGRFRAYAWRSPASPPPSPRASWYLIAVRLDGAGAARAGDILALQAAPGRRPMLARMPEAVLDASEFAVRLAAALATQQVAAATFLRQTFSTEQGVPDSVARFLAAYFRRVAREDGAIEIVGALANGLVLLQGWSGGLPGGASELVIETTTLADARLLTAEFARPDLVAPARGVCAVLRAPGIGHDQVQALYFVVSGEVRRIPVLPGRLALNPADTVAHVRGALPTLTGDKAALSALRQSARSRFAGQDTLSATPLPIAVAVDLALHVTGSGFYLTGWMLDGRSAISGVALRSTSGFNERVDLEWTRVARPDVVAAFANDGRFAGLSMNEDAGFHAFVAAEKRPAGGFYLEIEIGDDCLFLPLGIGEGDSRAGRRRILESVDLNKAAAPLVVERQIGPALRGWKPASARPEHTLLAGRLPEGCETAILMPVGTGNDILVPIAQFGVDRLRPDERLVLVCSSDTPAPVLRRITRALDFYAVEAAVVVSRQPIDAGEALNLGAALTDAPQLLLLSQSVVGRKPGWIGALRRAAERLAEADAVSPTILYEDFSVKFAGIDTVVPTSEAPYVEIGGACVGYSRHWLEGKTPRTVLAGTTDCCLVRRDAFLEVGGLAGGYALPDLKGLDFFVRLGAAGRVACWTPDVEVISVDDAAAAADAYWAKVGQLADGWMLAEALRQRAATTRDDVVSHLSSKKRA